MKDVISSCDTDCSIFVPPRRWVYKTQAEIFGEQFGEWRVSVFFQVGFVVCWNNKRESWNVLKPSFLSGKLLDFGGWQPQLFKMCPMQKWWTSSWKRWLNSKHCVCVALEKRWEEGGCSGKTCGFCMMLLHEMKLMSFEVEKHWVFLVQAIKTGVVRVARIAPSMKIFGLKTIGRVICRGAKSKWHVQSTQETEPVLIRKALLFVPLKYGGIWQKLRVSNIHDHPRLSDHWTS